MSPTDDTFITSSLDKTTRVWDLRSPKCSGYLNILEPAVCSIDPEGLLFAVGIGSDTIKLFDMRSYGKGPFVTFRLPKGRDARAQWTSLEFSPQGECILINTTGPFMYVAGSFQGNLHFELQGIQINVFLNACFSLIGFDNCNCLIILIFLMWNNCVYRSNLFRSNNGREIGCGL